METNTQDDWGSPRAAWANIGLLAELSSQPEKKSMIDSRDVVRWVNGFHGYLKPVGFERIRFKTRIKNLRILRVYYTANIYSGNMDTGI